MNCFFDTSALIKNYINEDGSAKVEELLRDAAAVVVSPVTLIECASVLSRLEAGHAITRSEAHHALEEIEHDMAFFDRVPFSPELESLSMRLVLEYNLRTLDSIQLASAVLRKNEVDKFVACDGRLLSAAQSEKLRVENPTEDLR